MIEIPSSQATLTCDIKSTKMTSISAAWAIMTIPYLLLPFSYGEIGRVELSVDASSPLEKILCIFQFLDLLILGSCFFVLGWQL